MVRVAGCTDTERADVGSDVNNMVIRFQVIKPVFRYFKTLPERCIPEAKYHVIR
jgi:hypothetical protein